MGDSDSDGDNSSDNIRDYIGTLIAERKPFDSNNYVDDIGYSQRQWDRTVGIGEVPEKYKIVKKETDN